MGLPLAWSMTTFNGGKFTRRTAAMLKWAQSRAGIGTFQIAQGGWNTGGVSASAGTHDKDAVDLRISYLSEAKKTALLKAMKDAGFAAWIRPTVAGLWGTHLHAVPIPPSKDPRTIARYLSPGAASQVLSYLAGRDGLAGNRVDMRKYRPGVRFSYLQNKPVPL